MTVKEKSGYKWVVLLVVSVACFLSQGTRQIYPAVLPQIKACFASDGVSDARLGLISSMCTLILGLFMPFAGFAADLLDRKRVLVAGSLMFSAGIFASGFATGLGPLLVTYGIVNAVGQSLMPPATHPLISRYHDDTCGTAFSICQAAIYAGIVVCSVSSGFLAGSGESGWRYPFLIFGAAGIAWAAVIAFSLKTPPQDKGDMGTVSVTEALKAFAEKPSCLILMAGLGCYLIITYAFKAWAPIFMTRSFPDMDTSQAVFHGVFWFYLGAFAGAILGGRASDALKPCRPGIRLEVELAGMILCIPFILIMSYSRNLALMIAAILMFGFATGVYDSNLYAALFDVIDPRFRAAGTGLFGCGGCIMGAAGPVVAGFLNDAFSPRTSMAALSVFAAAGAMAIFCARVFTFNKDKI